MAIMKLEHPAAGRPGLAIAGDEVPTVAVPVDLLATLFDRLGRMEADLNEVRRAVVEAPTIKEWYGIDEIAAVLGKSPYTLREHCRLGRIAARKRASGRGRTTEWAVSHAELTRFRNEGLLPLPLAEHAADRR